MNKNGYLVVRPTVRCTFVMPFLTVLFIDIKWIPANLFQINIVHSTTTMMRNGEQIFWRGITLAGCHFHISGQGLLTGVSTTKSTSSDGHNAMQCTLHPNVLGGRWTQRNALLQYNAENRPILLRYTQTTEYCIILHCSLFSAHISLHCAVWAKTAL